MARVRKNVTSMGIIKLRETPIPNNQILKRKMYRDLINYL